MFSNSGHKQTKTGRKYQLRQAPADVKMNAFACRSVVAFAYISHVQFVVLSNIIP